MHTTPTTPLLLATSSTKSCYGIQTVPSLKDQRNSPCTALAFAAGRAKLRGGAGAAGRQDVQQGHREARPPGPRLQPGPAQLPLRPERPHPDGHDRPLRFVSALLTLYLYSSPQRRQV